MIEPFTPSFFKRLQQLKIRTRRSFLGSRQGSHSSQRRGQGLEFSDFRPYTRGDDYRHIDWGVYGRSDRLYIRQFRAEQDLNVIVLLDTSVSMAFPEGENKFELARNIALSLGYIALTDGDSVVFSLLGKGNTPRFSGQAALARAAHALKEVSPQGRFDMLTEVRAAVASQRIPGKCFLISDFWFETEKQIAVLDYLRARNFEIAAIQIIAPGEIQPKLDEVEYAVDSESGEVTEISFDPTVKREYARALSAHVQSLEEYCHRSGVLHLLVKSDESLQDVVLTRFPAAGVLK